VDEREEQGTGAEAGTGSWPQVTERVRIIGAQPAGAAAAATPPGPGSSGSVPPQSAAGEAQPAAGEAQPAAGEAQPAAGATPPMAVPAGPADRQAADPTPAVGRAGAEPGDSGEPARRYLGFEHSPAGVPTSGHVPGSAAPAGDVPIDRAPGDRWHAPSGAPAGDAGYSSVEQPELPHWTEPPTGQVPAVLDRADEDQSWTLAGDTGPAWREHEVDWEDTVFEPALLADDEIRVGALDEAPLEQRRPWEFDDLGAAGAGAAAVGAGTDPPPTVSGEGDREVGLDDGDTSDEEGRGRAEPGNGDGSERAGEAADQAGAVLGGQDAGDGAPNPGGAGSQRRPGAVGVAAGGPDERGEWAAVPPGPPPAGHQRPRPRPRPSRARRGQGAPAGRGPRSGRNMPVAIASGVAVAAVAIGCMALGSVASEVLATVVVTLCAAEVYAALRRGGRHPATLLGLVATVAVMVAAYAKGVAALPLVFVLLVVGTMVWYLVGAGRGSAVDGMSATVFAFGWVGLLGSFAGLLLAPSLFPHRHGVAFFLGAIVAAVGNDVGALATGAWLGRRPLAPRVSPRKTWEGAVGGTVGSIVLSVVLTARVHPWTVPKAALLGLVVAIVAPVGDLCESVVKRDLGIKDMGSILPGHGGLVDRFDALLFALPATYYLVRVLNLG